MVEGAALIDARPNPPPAEPAPAPGATLAERLARGEPEAFDELVGLHERRLTRLAHRLLGWRGDVADVVQDVFLAALLHASRFRGEASLGTWLTRITVNKCRSHQRSLRVLWKRFTAGGVEEADPAAPTGADESASAEAEKFAKVRRAVQGLGPRDREVVVLRYFENMTLDAISALTGDSKNAVEVRLHRTRARLAGVLREVVEEDYLR
jgi:RNA polymerase sigma-70 factor (ECF subfamily)